MKQNLWRIIVALFLIILAFIVRNLHETVAIVLFLLAYLIVGFRVILEALNGILSLRPLDENLLMTIATFGAIAIGEYPEGVAVMLFYQIGELFESYAVGKSRKSIAELMNIRLDYANLKSDTGLARVDPAVVEIGDVIVVKVGEKVPLDGTVVDGSTYVDTSALTGESVPRALTVGEEILSGFINLRGTIEVKVDKKFGESTVSKILDLVENASSKKSQSEQFITRFARYYTPIVVGLAVLLAVVPPLIPGAGTFSTWFYRALTFLVVSCPCALVISIPLSFFGGIGGASRRGILIKGSNYLEALAKTDIMVMDKTGTLTKGVFDVAEINSQTISADGLLETAAYIESFSSHPISESLQRSYGKNIDSSRLSGVEELAGHGVKGFFDGQLVIAGNSRWLKRHNIPHAPSAINGTVVYLAIDGEYVGNIVISDQIKDDAGGAIDDLKREGIKKLVLLTGDNQSTADQIGTRLGINEVIADLLPMGKVAEVERLLSRKTTGSRLAFVGDGINDAPVLARADIGIAMGALGSDAAIEAADIVIMTDEISKIPTAIRISRKTLNIARQNVVFSIGVKVLVLLLSALGMVTMWAAIFADVGVAVLAILNSFRALNTKKL
ncbi:MAG TPA: cadmium-translocating P-type ATPase [Clostridiaceae bacterium]|nr:cadmium-translocating P-type ATPase [Clostridiaceae bacterium]